MKLVLACLKLSDFRVVWRSSVSQWQWCERPLQRHSRHAVWYSFMADNWRVMWIEHYNECSLSVSVCVRRCPVPANFVIFSSHWLCRVSTFYGKYLCSDVSSRTWPHPRGTSRTKSSGLGLGLGLGPKSLVGLRLEIKSSAIMWTLINSIYYWWQFGYKTEKMLNI